MVRYQHAARATFALLLALVPVPAQEVRGDATQPDPALARIGTAIERADAERSAGGFAAAREIVRAAVAECLALPRFAERADAHDLLWQLGRSAWRAEDLVTARDAWQRVTDYRERTSRADDPGLQSARNNLANALARLGDLPRARVLLEQVLAVRTRALPDDHRDLQRTRSTLAMVLARQGELREALALQRKVVAVLTETLPDDHFDLQAARNDLARTLEELGDLHGARALQEQVLAVLVRTLPREHRLLQIARLNLAATSFALGDVAVARSLEEEVLAVREETLPDDHPDLQEARQSLAMTVAQLGDYAGGRTLLEKVLDVRRRSLPDDHPRLQTTRSNLAMILAVLGDFEAARELQEKVLSVLEQALPEGHVNLQSSRNNLAATLSHLGDFDGARALLEQVVAGYAEARDDDPRLLRARKNLATALRELGELARARTIQEEVLAARARTLPDDHLDLQTSRSDLGWTCVLLGDAERADELARARAVAVRRSAARWLLSPRERGALANGWRVALDLPLTLAQGVGDLEPRLELAREALLTSEALRGLETRTARDSKLARAVDPERAQELETALRAAIENVDRVAAASPDRDDALLRAVREKERLQRELVALAVRAGGVDPAAVTVARLADRLPPGSAAAAVVAYVRHDADPAHRGRLLLESRLAALVLDRGGGVALLPLGTCASIEEQVARLRQCVGAGDGRGRTPGVAAEAGDAALLHAARALRRSVVEPILAAIGDCRTLYLSLDEALQLVPLDALPLADGTLVGERCTLRPVVSLFDLLEHGQLPRPDRERLVTVGGVDYGDPATEVKTEDAASGGAYRAPIVARWAPLPATAREVERIAGTFAAAFPAGVREGLRGATADERRFAAAVAGATFVHVATHGFFAPAPTDARREGGALDEFASVERGASGLSPLVLSGLVFAGANRSRDALGHASGVLTAEQILGLDFSGCALVTLSACDTSLGVSRVGQGYASLRAALLGAGARSVLASLWRVGDQPTMELMADFYRRLWADGVDPHAALWAARVAARRRGVAFRDWAGWVLVGR